MTQVRLTVVLILLVLTQLALALQIKDVRPTRGVLPDVLQPEAVDAMAFGDRQFLFRYLALEIQNAGDNGGRVTPLGNYDYDDVIAWLDLLDDLDIRSHWPIAMANGYFGQTQKVEDVAPVVRFMQAHTAADVYRKWPWLTRGVYLARHRLKNNWLALDTAVQQADYALSDMSPISFQLPALVLDDLGQHRRAASEMKSVMAIYGSQFRLEERRWMTDFVTTADGKAAESGGNR